MIYFSKKLCVRSFEPVSRAPMSSPALRKGPADARHSGRHCVTSVTAWSTPRIALEALSEGHFAQRTNQRTSELLALLQTVLRFCAEKNIQDHSDLDKTATRQVPESQILKQFRADFVLRLLRFNPDSARLFSCSLAALSDHAFFSAAVDQPPHDGWSFAERFYQRYLQGRGSNDTTENLVDEPGRKNGLPLTFGIFDQDPQRQYRPLSTNWHCRIFNTFGIHDEISAVAKEILRLVSDDNMALDQIGVVARSLDGYGASIKEVFPQHQIPIAASIEEPLVQFPLTKAAMLLLNLPAKDYLRSQVIDLLSSPYFQLNSAGGDITDLRPDLWDLATRELAICKGLKEWQRLERYTAKDLILSQISNDEEPRKITIAAAQLRALAKILMALTQDLNQLPAQASWNQYANSWKALLKKYLGVVPELTVDPDDTDTLVGNQIGRTLDQIARLDAVEPNVLLHEFSQTFQHWLERGTLVATNQNVRGGGCVECHGSAWTELSRLVYRRNE